jgi:hypothetical protein
LITEGGDQAISRPQKMDFPLPAATGSPSLKQFPNLCSKMLNLHGAAPEESGSVGHAKGGKNVSYFLTARK